MDGSLETTHTSTLTESLRKYLLDTITTTVPLDICDSKINGAGSGVIVQKSLDAAVEVFHVNTPFVTGITDPNTTCDNCCVSNIQSKFDSKGHYAAESVQLSACAKCKEVRYCSKKCQVSAWPRHHKTECKKLANVHQLRVQAAKSSMPGPQTNPVETAFLRLMTKYSRDELTQVERDAVHNLESHREEYIKDPVYSEFMNSPSLAFAQAENKDKMSADDVFDIYCKILTNSIAIRQPNNDQSLGVTMEPFCSMINHSCDPNVFYFFEDNQLRCRTLKAITAGEELFIAYTDPTYDALSRRKELLTGYYFQCSCSRCKAELAQLTSDDLKNSTFKMNLQEEILQSQREIATRALRPEGMDKLIRSVWVSTSPALLKQLGLENGWPDELQPMVDMHYFKARLTQGIETEYSLKTLLKLCFVTYPKVYKGQSGQDWVKTFSLLVFTLRIFIKSRSEQGTHRNLHDWGLVYIVYLNAMTSDSEECYGADTSFVKANIQLLREETSALTPETAQSAGLVHQFRADEREMFTWAGLTGVKGVKMQDTGLFLR